VRRKVDDERGERRRGHWRECLGAELAGTAVASVTGFDPLLTFLGMLTTPSGVPGRCACSGWVRTISPRRSASDRSTLSEVRPPTGEPDAGDPPVRFGGGGAGPLGPPYPYCSGLQVWTSNASVQHGDNSNFRIRN